MSSSVRRRRVVPPSSPSPRTSLESSSFSPINSSLKDIKLSLRRLHTVFVSFQDELQILRRLYYKGKNQHRPALFWKRVTEIRRYGDRVTEMGIPDIVDHLHYSFFGDGTQKSPKMLKGPWTCFPHPDYICFVVERVSACSTLVAKMHERLVEAYRSFTLAMQSGAFIQLVLTFAAIASRMDVLIPEMLESLHLTWSASRRIVHILNPAQAEKLHFSPLDLPRIKDPLAPSRVELDSVSPKVELAEHEDLGSSVPRPSLSAGSTEIRTSLPALAPFCKEDEVDTVPTVADEDFLHVVLSAEPIARTIVERKTPAMQANKTSTKRPSVETAIGQKKTKKKKKPRDEIDDIFG